MIKEITKIFDEENIKYNTIKKEFGGIKFVYIKTDIVAEATNEEYVTGEERFELTLIYAERKQTPYITFYVPDVVEIPKEYRSKIKNLVLDYNTTNFLSSFGIGRNSKNVECVYNLLLNFNENGQAVELKQLMTYIELISMGIKRFRQQINMLMDSKNEKAI